MECCTSRCGSSPLRRGVSRAQASIFLALATIGIRIFALSHRFGLSSALSVSRAVHVPCLWHTLAASSCGCWSTESCKDLASLLAPQVVDAKKASYGVDNALFAVTQLAQTTMRSDIGKISLDKTFEERDTLNRNIVEAIRHGPAGAASAQGSARPDCDRAPWGPGARTRDAGNRA